jgi:hypothetical protein
MVDTEGIEPSSIAASTHSWSSFLSGDSVTGVVPINLSLQSQASQWFVVVRQWAFTQLFPSVSRTGAHPSFTLDMSVSPLSGWVVRHNSQVVIL